MVAIKDMEMPKHCGKCGFNLNGCIFAEKADISIVESLPHRCPLVEIEPLTDEEKRIFLSSMVREEVICKQIDIDKVDDSTVKKLVPIVNSIKRKVKKTLWD